MKHGPESARRILLNTTSEFDLHCQSQLSTAMLQVFLMHDRHAEAAQCCERGACFAKEQLAEIDAKVPNFQRPAWLAEVLVVNAALNRSEALNLLLDHGADVAAANHNGFTALMLAARGGHEAVAKQLLDHGADAAAASHNGAAARLAAAQGGHEAVAKQCWTVVLMWQLQLF